MTEHSLARAPATEHDAPPSSSPGARLLLQRKCACGAGAGSSGECDGCAARRSLDLQRKENGAHSGQGIPSTVSDTLARPGRPLDSDTRSFMENRFNNDFTTVRIHDDSAAAASAEAVDARAYTVGQDIVFAGGQYQPHTDSGRHLLAHELAHTVQQQGLQRFASTDLADQGPQYQRLEHEADQAASSVMRGQPLASGLLSQGGTRLSRTANKGKSQEHEIESRYKGTEMTTGHKVTPEKKTSVNVKREDKELASFIVNKLELHEVKGPVIEEWRSKAKAGALRGIITMQGTKAQAAGHWQERVKSDELRSRWVNKRGWKMGDALNAAWQKAGGDSEFPKVGGGTCEMDHIIELQVGGDNTEENIQVLDRADNGMSGSLIKQQVFGLAQSIAQKMEKDRKEPPAELRMIFKDAKMKSTGKCGPCCKVAKKLKAPKKGEAGHADKSSEPLFGYSISAGGRTVELRIREGSKVQDIFKSGIRENVASAEVLPGLLLMTLHRVAKGKDSIHAMIDDRDRTRLPITLPAKGTKVVLNVAKNGDLSLSDEAKTHPGIVFTYDYLSEGRFTSLSVVEGGVAGEGYITTNKVPFLNRFEVAFTPNSFCLKAPLGKDKLKPPFPGVKIKDASLSMALAPKLKPDGYVSLEFGEAKKIAESKVIISADEKGLMFSNDLFVYLPGIDEAKGKINYRDGQWSGGATIESAQMAGKIPYFKSGSAFVSFEGGKIAAGGKIILQLPGGSEGFLDLSYASNKWMLQGAGTIGVKNPYLKPFQANLSYDGESFSAKGKAGFIFPGLEGTIDATYEYRKGNEKVSAKGDMKINKGRAQGSILVELWPNGKITGKGKLSYEIKKGLVATAGITVDEHQKIVFDGELGFPDITLFKRFPEKQEDHTLFKASGNIPIPGASIGVVGLKFKLWGSLGYYYSVGPGVLTGSRAQVKFSPFDADPDFSFNLKTKASIPADGGITGTLGADAVADAGIAEAGGGLNVVATAGLQGKVDLGGEIAYSKEKFIIDASAYIGGSIVLTAKLNARLFAEAGVSTLKVRTEKTWELLGGKFDTGLSLGVRMPLHYDSVEGPRMPTLSDIKAEPAQLDLNPSKMLDNLFAAAKSQGGGA
ncbi:DUF4157 domain-containing protein [Pseudomonas sp. WJP1]|uniref:eCIS core domain-containing protein n=1 Tax=Pseudomonas sp. WJP1 TaxID=2986947 RepID=UPI00234B3859|nr:DUF4157 domain-containing protein [Pseudomonas sp. WJP1]WCM54378.1 DUF4157 domain-containing protein [Pseudomonas sp. WJP1]